MYGNGAASGTQSRLRVEPSSGGVAGPRLVIQQRDSVHIYYSNYFLGALCKMAEICPVSPHVMCEA